MAKILVVDDEAVVREPIAATLRAEGHLVECAGDGVAAMNFLQNETPDIVLMDVRMPHKDGITLLQEIRANPSTAKLPVLLLSNAADKVLILQAARLGIQSYMLKSAFSLTELLTRIQTIIKDINDISASIEDAAGPSPPGAPVDKRALQTPPGASGIPAPATGTKGKPAARIDPSKWPRILTREQTLERLDRVMNGRAPAGVVAQLMSVASSSHADLSDVVRVIESDPILATRVLQLADSAAAGGRGRIRNVEDAARNLGARGIQNMAMSIGIVGAFPPDEQDGFNSIRCWQHSYAVADLFNSLMQTRSSEQESLNHLTGLCHDLGEILLRQHFAAEYAQVLHFAIDHHLPPSEVEGIALGVRHPELVSRLLIRMGLPPAVVQAIRAFYDRQTRDEPPSPSGETTGLSFANLAAHGLLLAASARDLVRPITRAEWRLIGKDKTPPSFDPAAKRQEILTATAILARLPAKEEQRLLTPLVPRHDKRILYIRPDSYVEFDPLAYALSLCSTVQIASALPPPDQCAQLDGMVVVGPRAGTPPVVPERILNLVRNAAPALPVLALVAKHGEPECQGHLQIRAYPVGLDALTDWLKTLPTSVPLA
jgi:HD-like signal output (HDOD) protein/CheY-like chemotaxis protein